MGWQERAGRTTWVSPDDAQFFRLRLQPLRERRSDPPFILLALPTLVAGADAALLVG
jgi:hypothetical protein